MTGANTQSDLGPERGITQYVQNYRLPGLVDAKVDSILKILEPDTFKSAWIERL